MATSTPSSDKAVLNIDGLLPDLEALYKDLHSHPELSMQETRTARVAADRLRAAGYEVTTAVGKTGVVGVLNNGDGPTVMCVPTWMRCRCRRQPVWITPAR
jgi:hippurate hydrolase